ncbi:hypothetical protein [Erwinia tracheiphila]|nr:hypothetical protein [Erwinia tracheiphila]
MDTSKFDIQFDNHIPESGYQIVRHHDDGTEEVVFDSDNLNDQ